MIAETEIGRVPAEVAAFAMEAENDTRWIGGISTARRLTPPPTGIGTRVERVATFMGRRIEYVMDVVELVPNERIVLKSVKAPFPMRVTYEFVLRDGKTLASVRVQGEPAGFYKIAGGLMAPAVKKNLIGDLKRLKAIVESEA
ncbi:MAG: SRPBCC domain-containing protein [Actinomycetota bacterium]